MTYNLKLNPKYQALLDVQLPKKIESQIVEPVGNQKVQIVEHMLINIGTTTEQRLTRHFEEITDISMMLYFNKTAADIASIFTGAPVGFYFSEPFSIKQKDREILHIPYSTYMCHFITWFDSWNYYSDATRSVITTSSKLSTPIDMRIGPLVITSQKLNVITAGIMYLIFKGWAWV